MKLLLDTNKFLYCIVTADKASCFMSVRSRGMNADSEQASTSSIQAKFSCLQSLYLCWLTFGRFHLQRNICNEQHGQRRVLSIGNTPDLAPTWLIVPEQLFLTLDQYLKSNHHALFINKKVSSYTISSMFFS